MNGSPWPHLRLVPPAAPREVPTHCVRFDDARAALLYGEEFRRQYLYAWSLPEAEKIRDEKGGEIEPA